MENSKKPITRRDFIKGASCAAAGMAIGLPAVADEVLKDSEKSKVVLVRHKDAVDSDGKARGPVIQDMLDEAMTSLFGKDDPVACWRQIIKSDDIVGIKTNTWGKLTTTSEVEQAIKRRLLDVGVAGENISTEDQRVLENPVFKRATALINARPFRTHAWSGVGSLIKNYIMFSPDPPKYHPDSCATLGSIWHLPLVKDKTRLNILVLLTPLFYGVGYHHYDPKYVWPYKGLLVGTDPVAMDTIGLRLFAARRKAFFGEERPISPSPHHIKLADTEYNLGTSDPSRIELVKLGWQEDVLI